MREWLHDYGWTWPLWMGLAGIIMATVVLLWAAAVLNNTADQIHAMVQTW